MANNVTRRWWFCLSLVLYLPTNSWGMPQNSAPLMINTEEYPPFNYADEQQQIVGSATSLLRDALQHTDIEAQFILLPWARAYTQARLNADHCVYSTTRTDERESLFRWVGPLVINEWAAFSLAGHEINAGTLSALKNWRVGSVREDAVGNFVAAQGINVLRAPSERENVARLKAGLLDVIVLGKATGEFIAEEQDVALTHLFTFAHAPLYLACHPSVSEALLERLQLQLDALRPNTERNNS